MKNLSKDLTKEDKEILDQARKRTLEEQERYNRYNKDLLSYMKTKSDLVNQLMSELSPLLEKAIEIFVNYLVDDTDGEGEIVDNTYFYKEPKIEDNDNVITNEYCPFHLTSKSLEEINKLFDIDLNFAVSKNLDLCKNLDLSSLNMDDYDKVTYTINDYINYSLFVYNNLGDNNNSADLILMGKFEDSQHKLEIYTRKYIKDDYIENLISAIFLDSGFCIVNPVEKITENNKDCCCNNEPTEKELNAIEQIKKAAEEARKIVDNGKIEGTMLDEFLKDK